MITFTLCLLALIVGYFTYGRLMERVFGPDDRKTPALTKADGVDYIPLPTWKIFMIFQALDPRQKVVSHHLMRQPLLYFFNRHLIYFCYFFH